MIVENFTGQLGIAFAFPRKKEVLVVVTSRISSAPLRSNFGGGFALPLTFGPTSFGPNIAPNSTPWWLNLTLQTLPPGSGSVASVLRSTRGFTGSPTLLPSHVIDSIIVFPTHRPSSPPIWKLSSNGSFSFKSAWQAIRTPRSPNPIFRHIWSSLITPTISTFMVRLLSFWISTPDGLSHRGINASIPCFCCEDMESIPHLFLLGPVASAVWANFYSLAVIPQISSDSMQTTLSHWFNFGTGKSHLFHLIPILILWYLWCSRNDKIVKQIPFTAQRVCDRSIPASDVPMTTSDHRADAHNFSQQEIPSPSLAGLTSPSPSDSSPSSLLVRAPFIGGLSFSLESTRLCRGFATPLLTKVIWAL
ncbi:RNA-directed DNA polymerase (reversetranscriptase)-related family protein [Striga asiatica]|uniref:RNA-directed DNA polymerase (Reversetranscriptase)-related family protein n=1 Tax=Striga asiatica TaxID=4170 RepID=A0A5A7PF13_STRAF|nr:RNA-directed DNA polymerase (reversetranscriptase)-related family protein [Striga asiatica]